MYVLLSGEGINERAANRDKVLRTQSVLNPLNPTLSPISFDLKPRQKCENKSKGVAIGFFNDFWVQKN